MARGESRADQNRKIRREELRAKLAAGGHVDHVIDIANKLSDLDEDIDPITIQRLKAAADIKKGLIAKYLPDVKAVELTGEDGGDIKTDNKWSVEFIDAKDEGK